MVLLINGDVLSVNSVGLLVTNYLIQNQLLLNKQKSNASEITDVIEDYENRHYPELKII